MISPVERIRRCDPELQELMDEHSRLNARLAPNRIEMEKQFLREENERLRAELGKDKPDTTKVVEKIAKAVASAMGFRIK